MKTEPILMLVIQILAMIRLISYFPALVLAVKDRNSLVLGVVGFLCVAIIMLSFFGNVVAWAIFGGVGSMLDGIVLEKYLRLKRACAEPTEQDNG